MIPPMPPLRLALLAQVLGAFLAFALAGYLVPDLWNTPLALALTQGVMAATISLIFRGPPWWLPIHLAFLPLAVLASRLPLASSWWLVGFFLLLAVFWRTDRSRVPLYLSNRTTADTLATLLPAAPCRVLDLGCGTGSLLARLSRARPDCQFTGIEHAPIPWLVGRLRSLGQANLRIELGNFWPHPLAEYQVVYAFLSPEPMPRLWQEACARMAPGAMLVSNSFPVPGVAEAALVQVQDGRHTRLYCYHPVPPAITLAEN